MPLAAGSCASSVAGALNRATSALAEVGIAAERRPEELDLGEWVRLATALGVGAARG